MSVYKDHNGIVRLFDGTIVYVMEVQYSHNGINDWESEYNAYQHTVETTAKVVPGHKYMRIRHAGDEHYQKPIYITATDGRSPQMQISGTWVQWKLEGSDTWLDLFDTSLLKGEQGDRGPQGAGLHVDKWCWYADFIFSSPSISTVESCNRCSTPSSSNGIIVGSLGDGQHKITALDISNGLYRSTDGINWVAMGVNDEGRYTRFTAEDAIGTNYIDYRDSDVDYSSKGKVYVYSNSRWTELTNLATPNYMVAPNNGDPTAGQFMSDYESDTIALDGSNNLEVVDDSISLSKIKSEVVGYGLDEVGAAIEVDPSEFTGKGITTYTSVLDSKKKLALDTSVIVSDGLELDTAVVEDGYSFQPINVKPSDFIDQGLEIVVGGDTYDNIKVKAADAIVVDADGVNVKADELTINTLDQSQARVYPTDNNAKGIQALHLHKNTVNQLAGLAKGTNDSDVLGALRVKVDGTSIGFDGTGNLEIPDNGVEGLHLNDNVANEAKGIKVQSNKLEVKVHPSGGIVHTTDGLALEGTTFPTVHSDDIPDLEDSVLASVEAAGYIKDSDLRDNQTFRYDAKYGVVWRSPNGAWWRLGVTNVGDFEPKNVNIGFTNPSNEDPEAPFIIPIETLTVPAVTGAIENDGVNLWFTDETQTRHLLNSKTFGTIKVTGQDDVVSALEEGELTLAAGANITLTTNNTTKTITIAAASGNGSVATVGSGGDYATVYAAFNAGYRYFKLIGNVVETSAINSSDTIYVSGNGNNGYSWTIGSAYWQSVKPVLTNLKVLCVTDNAMFDNAVTATNCNFSAIKRISDTNSKGCTYTNCSITYSALATELGVQAELQSAELVAGCVVDFSLVPSTPSIALKSLNNVTIYGAAGGTVTLDPDYEWTKVVIDGCDVVLQGNATACKFTTPNAVVVSGTNAIVNANRFSNNVTLDPGLTYSIITNNIALGAIGTLGSNVVEHNNTIS